VEQCAHCRTKRSSIPLRKNCDIIVSFNNENGTKVEKLARDFDIPRTTLTTTLKNKEKAIFQFFLSEYARKHDTVSGNPNQRTL